MAYYERSRTNPLQFVIALQNGDEIVALGSVGDITQQPNGTTTARIEAKMTVYRIKHSVNREQVEAMREALKPHGVEVEWELP